MTKRVLSMLLVLAVLVSLLPVRSEATEPTVSQQDTQVGFEATNDFGGLLTNTLADSDQAQTASDVNRICDVQIEGDYAWVEFTTTERARLVVAIYTEDGTKMLGSGTQTVSPEETEVGIQIDIDNMPQYYSAGAYLLSAADNTPLSKEFRTQLYTKVVQDIKNSTVDDYDPERVLNLDDDRTTNFAVFGENTILLDSSVSITISGDTYTIENASDDLKAMQPGDSFAQTQENGEVLIVKAAQVKVSGDSVTITDDPDADLSDVFEVVKIEGNSDPDNVTWDDSTLDEALAVVSDVDSQSSYESQEERKIEFSEKKEFSRDYVFAKDKDTGVTGKITAKFSVGADVYIKGDYKYISYKLETAIAIDISVTLKLIDKSIPLEKIKCPLIPGTKICNVVIIPKIIFKVSGKIVFKGSVKCTLSQVYDSDNADGWQDTSSAPKFEHETAISASLFLGVGLEGGLEFLDDKIFYVSVEGQVGAEIKVKSKLQELSSASTSSIHPCEICFSGTVGGNLELSSGLKLLGKDIIGGDTGLQGAKFTFEWSLFNFYYCADDEDWGFGTCPHISYKVKLNILDRYDQPMKDITFQLHQGSYNITEVLMMDEEHNISTGSIPATNEDGNAVFYLPNGYYQLDVLVDGEVVEYGTFTVLDTVKELPIHLDIDINKAELTMSQTDVTLALGQTKQLTAKFGTFYSQLDVTNACTWQSSDEAVLKIENGTIIPVSQGEATITVSYIKDGEVYTNVCIVQVWEKYGLTLSQESVDISIGSMPVALTARFGYGQETDVDVTKDCQWTSSDTDIVTVNGGFISTQTLGTATVTAAYTLDGEVYTAQCEVTVEPRPVIASGSCGENLVWALDDLGTLSISGTGKMEDCPNHSQPWYSYHSSIASVVIGTDVASIGHGAFNGCYNLTSVSIADSVTVIGDYAFYACSRLTSIVIPKGVTYISSNAFDGCSSLTSITLPEGVAHINGNAFSSCISLTEITIPKSVTDISDRAFEFCSSLKEITIPESVTHIGWGAFRNCTNLVGITLPKGITEISQSMFSDCVGLNVITIPDGVTDIGMHAFEYCRNLKSITIPNSVNLINHYAFGSCTSLTDVYYSGTKTQWQAIIIYDLKNDALRTATIHCTDGVIIPTTEEDIAPASLVPGETEPTEAVTEPVAEETEATIPEVTEAVTEPVVVETQPEVTEAVTEPTEAATEATEAATEATEATVETSLVSHRSWRILPSGAEMRTGAVVKLAAFTGKETTQNGLHTVSFTGLEPGEEYVLIVSLVPGSVAPEDLMYITQGTANDSGALTLNYIPRRDVTAIVQLYGIPTDRGIALDREYVTMKAGAASERLTATVTPAQWADTLVWESSDETVLQVGADGSLTPVTPGTAYAIATVTHGKYTLSTRCRVDVTEDVPNVAVTAVVLGTSKVTTQLYSRDYVNFDILLLLEQNLPQIAAFSLEETPQDNGVAITGAKFADETVRSLFDLQVKDDRTLTLIPTQAAIAAGQTLKSSYSSPVIVSVNGVEFHTDSILTISVRKSTPKLSAKALSFNSFYTGQAQAISITGGTPTAITGTTPDWLALEDGKLSLTGTEAKASATVSLSVETEEWAIPATVKVKASVSYKAPSLKLSKTSLTFSNVHSKGIPLTLSGGKQALAELGVRDLRADDGFAITDLNLEKGSFTLLPTGTVSPGKHTITVFFQGTESTLPLSVQVSTKAPTIRLSRSSVKLNARTGDSVTLNLTASPSDFDLTQVELSEESGTLTVTQVDEMGCFSLSTAPQSEAPKSCSLTATAPGGNTVRLTISMISAAPTMTAKASGKIDLSYPQTGLTITPVLKNYSGALTSSVYSLSVKSGKDWEDMDIAAQFTLSSNGKLYQAPTFSLPSGTLCRITLQGQLPDGTPMLASVLVKVTQTPIPLKLSKTSLTLNKALGEWASITVSTSVRGYPLGTPEIRLTDSKGSPSQALDFHYQDGQLKVAVNDATAYGQTYQLRLWVTPTKVAILRVKILSEKQSSVVLSAKAKGSIDVIRDDSEIVITPSYRNYAGQMPLTRQVRITMAQSKENEAQDVSHQFLWAWSSDGKLHLQKAPGALLDLTARYRLELAVEGGAKAAVVNLNLRSGSAKVRLTQPAVLYAKDVNSQSLLTFQISDKSLNALEHVQIRGAKQNERFAIVPWAGSQFSIIQVPGSTPKSSRITLELFFEGNTTQKPNAIATASVTIR